MPDLTQLNEEQLQAVEHRGGPLLVLAGAGSGKTRVLTARIARLLGQGEPPDSILALTFTNRAAREMRERVEEMAGEAARGVWLGTFHAACARILRQEAVHWGGSPGFVIYDRADQLALVRSVLKDMNLDQEVLAPQLVLDRIGRAKNALVGPHRFVDYCLQQGWAQGDWSRRLADVYASYQRQLADNNALDFDDLLFRAVQLFRENGEVLGHYRQRYRHILVDEYQDTNHCQYQFLRLLAPEGENLMVVGDDFQSIYAFRGADLNNILDFEQDYPRTRVIKLEQNYRSSANIVEASGCVMAYNYHQKEKKLWTEREPGPRVALYQARDQGEEARFVGVEAGKLREAGCDWSGLAVLYRTNAQSRVFEDTFRSLGIPYRLVGTLGFYQRREIKDLLAYLRLLLNPRDALALDRIINVPRRGAGPAGLEKIKQWSREQGWDLHRTLAEAHRIPRMQRLTAARLRELGSMLQELAAEAPGQPAAVVIRQVLEQSGYEALLRQEASLENQNRLENVQELVGAADQFAREAEDAGLEAFLTSVSLLSEADATPEDEDALLLLTAHNAKGLEFPVVFLTGLEEGLFPHSRAQQEPGGVEEERRLFYVAMTRARDRLYLTGADSRELYGRSFENLPSRFLQELPPDCCQNLKCEESPGGFYSGSGRGRQDPKRGNNPLESPLVPGDAVEHPKLGRGRVVQVEGTGEETMVTVAFPNGGLKRLLQVYAKLRRATG